MKKYPYKEAKQIIQTICAAADSGEFDSREKFMSMVEQNPHIAVQGYNAFGKIFYWNNASTLLYGHGESVAINQDLVELILPPEMRPLARQMIAYGRNTGKMPDASPCDLLRYNGEFVTVFSGHLVFQWDDATVPEFYCVDLAIHPEKDEN